MSWEKIAINDIDAIVFDCDGVLTNNCVYLDQNGTESVAFNRSDGLGFDMEDYKEIDQYCKSKKIE